jgi:hypothetical protein
MICLRNRFIKIFLLVTIFITFTTCTYTWRAIPELIDRQNQCLPYDNMPQMIKIPLFTQSWQIVENCRLFESEKVGIALLVFHNSWRLKFGDHGGKIWKMLDDIMIEWSQKDRRVASAYSLDGFPVTDVRVTGITLSRSIIWVHVEENDKICNTSFAHELVHAAIWALKQTDGDPDHLGNNYSGWTLDHNILIQEVNATLCGLGI